MTKLMVVTAALAASAGVVVLGSDEKREPAAGPAARPASITTAGLVEHLRELERIAERNGGNRAAGTDGYSGSVTYVAGRLRAAGYRVELQPVRFAFFSERRRPRLSAGGRRWASGRDVRSLIYTGSGSASGAVRPIGIDPGGASRAGCDRDDFAKLRRGEVALLQRGVCTLNRKAFNAQAEGAAAVLIANEGGPGTKDAYSGTLGRPGLRIPALGISSRAGGELAGRPGRRARVSVDAVSERRTTTNVIADSPGGNPRRVLMAGGHLDSVTDGPGINDNGSGVATLLESAELLAGSPREEGPRLRFAFWGAEELGLLGSSHYVRRLGAAGRRGITGYVNLDMVGSPNAVRAVYDGDARIERVLRRRLEAVSEREVEEERLGGSSDHAPFAGAGIPVGGLYSGSSETKSAGQARAQGGRAGRPLDPCYHRACDRLENVDRRVLTEIATAMAEALGELGAHRQR